MATLRAVDIPDDQTIACEETVAMLEAMLELAKQGKIHGAMLVAECAEPGTMLTKWTNSMDFRRRMANLELLKLDWYMSLHGEAEEK